MPHPVARATAKHSLALPRPTLPHAIPRREAAMAWEAAFVRLAGGRLSEMAAGAGLRLSFSSERSVQDELARESTSGGWVGGGGAGGTGGDCGMVVMCQCDAGWGSHDEANPCPLLTLAALAPPMPPGVPTVLVSCCCSSCC